MHIVKQVGFGAVLFWGVGRASIKGDEAYTT